MSKLPLEELADGQLKLLHLRGGAYARVVQHGQLLKTEIKAVTDAFLRDIGETTGEKPQRFIDQFLRETDFVTSLRRWTPELLEEIRGIADGSELPHSIIFMHQLGDEFFFRTKYLFAHRCSSLGIRKNAQHPTMTAQNMDIQRYFHGYQTVMKITDEAGRKTLLLTIPGHLGITGMNDAAVAINCNTLIQLQYRSTGLPVTGVVRGVLQRDSHAAAVKWVRSLQHASAQNYIIGDRETMTSLECSANAVAAFWPFENAPFTYHTNFPLANRDYSDWYLASLRDKALRLADVPSLCQRFPAFARRFPAERSDFGLAAIKEVLRSRDHAGKDVLSNRLTYASVIYLLSDEPVFIIAPGKPHETDYLELTF